ncbi:MAG: helix-turn-helix transcriptional regulator [Spirochaetales bacterium]|nr:helix-turn-helix transcriptional regulator [Spirochaetales bacterium]
MAILQSLKSGPLTVSDIEKITGKSHSTTSQQLKSMLNVNLLTFRKEGTQKFYQIRDNQIFDMLESISSYLSTSEVISTKKVVKGKSMKKDKCIVFDFSKGKRADTSYNLYENGQLDLDLNIVVRSPKTAYRSNVLKFKKLADKNKNSSCTKEQEPSYTA